MANVDRRVVEDAEAYKRVPIRDLEKIARALGLDERFVSWREEPEATEQQLGVRLRTIGDEHPRMTPHAVSAIAEAAWVASTQVRLQRMIGLERSLVGIEPSENYGTPSYPSYRHGYFLAFDARMRLDLDNEPIASLRDLIEDRLNIPIIQTEMGPSIAGVTVEIGPDRAIVANLDGKNRNVLVRRSTLAHELGHLLYDPPHRLKALRVDEYDDLERPPHHPHDAVEQRANAFAVEFIAPQKAVEEYYRQVDEDGVWEVMNTFGLSFTSARYHIWNVLERAVPFDQLQLLNPGRRIDQKWEASESYTLDYHPLPSIRPSRAGRFSAIVLCAAEKKVLSWDSAAEMLEVTVDDLKRAAAAIRDLFPSLFK